MVSAMGDVLYLFVGEFPFGGTRFASCPFLYRCFHCKIVISSVRRIFI